MKHEASSVCLSLALSHSLKLSVVASSMWISEIENHFTRAKSRVQRFTKNHITSIKRPFLLLSFLLPLAPSIWKVLLLSMSVVDGCFDSRTVLYIFPV